MVAANDWTKTPWPYVLAAILGSTGVNQGLQLSFPSMRAGAWTADQADWQRKDMEGIWEDKLDEYKARTERNMIEIADAKVTALRAAMEAENAETRLYMHDKFLPINTPIPPPQVLNILENHEGRIGRMEEKADGNRERIFECCAAIPRSSVESIWRDEFVPTIPRMVLSVQ